MFGFKRFPVVGRVFLIHIFKIERRMLKDRFCIFSWQRFQRLFDPKIKFIVATSQAVIVTMRPEPLVVPQLGRW